MYKIYADDTLIYDSTVEDYKIGKGSITLEVNKSGSFVFSVYPDHFFYDSFVKLKTVITVYKSGRIVFRGRILNDVTDYWNNKNITCEGELGFLQDSIIRPFSFTGSPEALFKKFIEEHNSQVDDFKKFKIGEVTVVDANEYINRSSANYSESLSVLNSALTGSALGGYFYITHGEDGTDPIPTINYLADFTTVSSQTIEFGSNLKNYTKTVKAEDMATAIIPFGASTGSNNQKLTIEDVNGGLDYVYSKAGVELYGWIFKTVVWDNVTLVNNLKKKAEEYLESVVNQNITIELNAIDLHLLDQSIESFRVCDYVHVKSEPHNLDAVLLCNKQTMDLLKPENDTVVLGYQSPTFTGTNNDMATSISSQANEISSIKQDAASIKLSVENLDKNVNSTIEQTAESIRSEVADEVSGLRSTIEQTASSIRSEIDDEVEGLYSTIEQTAESIRSEISGYDGAISRIEQKVDGITLEVSNGETSSTIKLMSGETEISSETIKLTGVVTFSGLADGTTTIDGACIKTGTINAARLNLTGAISWSDLGSGVQTEITDAQDIAIDAQDTADDAYSYSLNAYYTADNASALAQKIANGTFSGGTFIDGTTIYSPTIYANEFSIFPESQYSSGSFNLYGYFGSSLYNFMCIDYYDDGASPQVEFSSPAGGYSTWSFRHTRFTGTLDFSQATIIGLNT